MAHAKTQRRKGVGTALRAVRGCSFSFFFAPLLQTVSLPNLCLCVRFFLCSVSAPKARQHTSLGRSPRYRQQEDPRAEGPAHQIVFPRKDTAGLQPCFPFLAVNLGRWPRLVCLRAFGPPLCLLAAVIMTGCVPASVPRTPGVSGHVYNARTKKPVVGAVVTFANSPKIATKTDTKGAFTLLPHQKLGLCPILPFDALPCRTLLLIMHEGYHDYSSWVWLIKPNSGVKAMLQPNH